MRYRQVGSSGLTVSVVGLGCNSFGDTLDPSDVDTVVGAAIDSGITLFDTADIYGGAPGQGEELLGAALGKRRDDVVLATKAGMDTQGLAGPAWECRGSRRYLHRAVEGSLRRLQTDHIDLLQLHEPDPITPIDETLAALDDLVRSGKVRYIGSSNFTAWQVVDADWTARTSQLSRFVAAQNPYSLLNRGMAFSMAGWRDAAAATISARAGREGAGKRREKKRKTARCLRSVFTEIVSFCNQVAFIVPEC